MNSTLFANKFRSARPVLNCCRRLPVIAALILCSAKAWPAFKLQTDTLEKQLNHIYKSSEEGYSCFRIPAIVSTGKGILLAFAEGRRNNCGDAGDIDLVVKSSGDGGKTWTGLRVVWDDSANTCGNPAPVVDKKSGNILLLATWNKGTDHEKDIIARTSKDTRRVFVLSSHDDGRSWSAPQEITKRVKPGNWTWYATGPGSGMQITKGKHKGRLVVACDHIETETNKYFSHVIYSDNRGRKWKLGGTTPQDRVNESTVAELSDGKLMLNMRNFGPVRNRQVSTSADGGSSWSALHADESLVEPICEGSLMRYNFPGKEQCLVFSNPASKESRSAMTVQVSYDDGKTWPSRKLLYKGPSAYSNVVVLPNGNIGCLYEAGYAKAYEGIVFEEVPVESLQNSRNQ